MATLTINGLLKYDDSLFDGFRVPTLADLDPSLEIRGNAPVISRSTAIEKIIFETLGLSLVYTAPDDVKAAIKLWTDTNFNVWVQMYQTMVLKYNPIWNKDGTITETHHGDFSRDNEGTGKHNVTGYDSPTYSPDTEDVGTGHDEGKDNYTDTRVERGNIGVTSTQQLIREERESASFSLYQYIADSFKYEFCVCIY